MTQAESNFKGWNYHVHREFPGYSESTNLSRYNLSREIGHSVKLAIFYPPSEVDGRLGLVAFAGSEGKYLCYGNGRPLAHIILYIYIYIYIYIYVYTYIHVYV